MFRSAKFEGLQRPHGMAFVLTATSTFSSSVTGPCIIRTRTVKPLSKASCCLARKTCGFYNRYKRTSFSRKGRKQWRQPCKRNHTDHNQIIQTEEATSLSSDFNRLQGNGALSSIQDLMPGISDDCNGASSQNYVSKATNGRLQVFCRAPREKGRVGLCTRAGNISLASFGLKVKRDKQGTKIDIQKSLSKMLPYIVVATAAAALTHPATFAWVSKDHYAPALGGIMLSIGVQLSISDFALILQKPLPLFIGYVLQYVLKPILGFLVVRAFGVPPAFAAGLILTACVAGAQLSSYAAYLSEGDIALSIMLTSISTITSVVVTPFLTQWLIGSVVPVDVVAMAKSILQVVFVPILTGLTLNTYAKPLVDRVRPVMPLIAMVCTSLCIGSPLALNQAAIVSVEGLRLLFPVLAFHACGFALGYYIPRLPFWRQEAKVSKTLSLCTGMQSSTLAMLLATQFLGGTHAVPPACSVVVMAVMGLTLASLWGRDTMTIDAVDDGRIGAVYA